MDADTTLRLNDLSKMNLKAENIAKGCLLHTEGKVFCTYLPWQDALGNKEAVSYQNPAWFIWTGGVWRQHPLRNADWWLDDWWRHCPDPVSRPILLSRKATVRKMFTALLTVPFPLLAADPGFPVVAMVDSSAIKDWRHDPDFAYRHAPGYATSAPNTDEIQNILAAAKTWAIQCIAAEGFTPIEEILASLREWLTLSRPGICISDHDLQRLLPWILSDKRKIISGESGYAVKLFRRRVGSYERTQGTGTHT